jgi:beta-glucanase (GH16 family)
MLYRNFTLILLIIVQSFSASGQDFLRWADEFNGTILDSTNWEYQIGDGCPDLCGWGNNELQSYQKKNVTVSNGILTILAKKESFQNSSYTSARIRSLNKFDFASGRIDVRARLPRGKGYWPAVWFLPSENYYGTWPLSGEIDLMEGKGQEIKNTYGTIHYGAYPPNNKYTGATYTLPTGDFVSTFHTFTLLWKLDTIEWLVDGISYSKKTKKDLPDFWWPYNRNFHFIANLAVGGNFLGYPDASTPDTASLQIDYIRVYQNLEDIFITGPDAILRNDVQKLFYTQKLDGATYEWIAPAGSQIVSGQGTSSIRLNWGLKSDTVKVKISFQNKTKTISKFVLALPDTCEGVIDNQEEIRSMYWVGSNGNYRSSLANPSKDSINSSNLCSRYYRSSTVIYDALIINTDLIKNAKAFEDGNLILKMKLYTIAPIGTEVNLNFENRALAALPYPSGRRCVLQAKTTKTRVWEELTFKLILKPDPNTPEAAINQLVLLFAPNTNSSDVFYFDDFSIKETPCKQETTGMLNQYNEASDISVFPNPFTNEVNISAQFIPTDIELTDLVGKSVIRAATIDEFNKYVATLCSGAYYLRLTNDTHNYYFKLVKQMP